VPTAEAAGKGVRALALGHEHPHPARPHRRESAGRIGPQAREALDAVQHERGRETDRALDRSERCVVPLPCARICFFLLSHIFFFEIASIFKRMSDVPDLDYNTSQDFTAAYKVSPGHNSTRRFLLLLSRIVVAECCRVRGRAEIHRLQKDADDRREARTHARDRPALHPRAYIDRSASLLSHVWD
jgi:hypothetical protein